MTPIFELFPKGYEYRLMALPEQHREHFHTIFYQQRQCKKDIDDFRRELNEVRLEIKALLYNDKAPFQTREYYEAEVKLRLLTRSIDYKYYSAKRILDKVHNNIGIMLDWWGYH